eukprot:1181564-Prorocentrum_minimum.AAC.3
MDMDFYIACKSISVGCDVNPTSASPAPPYLPSAGCTASRAAAGFEVAVGRGSTVDDLWEGFWEERLCSSNMAHRAA